jgi:hypothetical protein
VSIRPSKGREADMRLFVVLLVVSVGGCYEAFPFADVESHEGTGDSDDAGDDGHTGDAESVVDCDLGVPGDYASIPTALWSAEPGSTVCVAAGTYHQQVDFGGRAVRLIGVDGSAVTVIDGAGFGPVVSMTHGEGPETILEGFTITGSSDGHDHTCFNLDGASPTLRDLVVMECTGEYDAGAMNLTNSSPTITNVTFDSNTSEHEAGAVCLQSSSPVFNNVAFYNNFANNQAGSLYVRDGSHPILTNVIFAGNGAGYEGGAVNLSQAAITMTNVTIHGNGADNAGGGIEVWDSSVELTNVSITGSRGPYGGSGINIGRAWTGNSSVMLRFCNVWGNGDPEVSSAEDPAVLVDSLAVDPMFLDVTPADPREWDLHLGAASGLVDAGDPSILDPDGSRSDIGAYGGPGADASDLLGG